MLERARLVWTSLAAYYTIATFSVAPFHIVTPSLPLEHCRPRLPLTAHVPSFALACSARSAHPAPHLPSTPTPTHAHGLADPNTHSSSTPNSVQSPTGLPQPSDPSEATHTPASHVSSRPSLSLGFKKALARHQQALQAGFGQSVHCPSHQDHQHLDQQQQQGSNTQHRHGGLLLCAEDAMLQGVVGGVADASQCFLGSLAHYYGPGKARGSPDASLAGRLKRMFSV